MKDWQSNLVAYGTHLLASQLGKEWPPPSSEIVPGSFTEGILGHAETYHQDDRLGLARKIARDTSLETGLEPCSQIQSVAPVELYEIPGIGREIQSQRGERIF